MKAREQKLDKQVQFWAMMGPLMVLISVLLILYRLDPSQIYLPLLALLGTIVCWKWKLPGLGVSTLILIGIGCYEYFDLPVEERFFYVGLRMSVVLGFMITALSFEEVEAVVQKIHHDATGRLKHLLHLDEKLKATEKEKREFHKQLRFQLENVTIEGVKEREKRIHTHQIFEVASDEVARLTQDNEQLAQSISSLHQKNEMLQERLEDAVSGENEALRQLALLSRQVKNKEKVADLSESLDRITGQKERLEVTVQYLEAELKKLREEKDHLIKLWKLSQIHHDAIESENQQLIEEIKLVKEDWDQLVELIQDFNHEAVPLKSLEKKVDDLLLRFSAKSEEEIPHEMLEGELYEQEEQNQDQLEARFREFQFQIEEKENEIMQLELLVSNLLSQSNNA